MCNSPRTWHNLSLWIDCLTLVRVNGNNLVTVNGTVIGTPHNFGDKDEGEEARNLFGRAVTSDWNVSRN